MQSLNKIVPRVVRICCTILLLLAVFIAPCHAQQVADNNYTAPAFAPRYLRDSGSVVMIDEAHNNFHTADTRYAPFAKVLTDDGFKIIRGKRKFTEHHLEDVKILVIANALDATNINNWRLPTPSAFTAKEIETVTEWVRNGGSLFLIADHMPFAGAAADLAKAFGFNFYNGFAVNPATYKHSQPDVFKRNQGFHPTGLPGLEGVDSIATFMGQAFTIPPDAVAIISLDEHFKVLMPAVAWKFDKNTGRVSGKGTCQLACLKFGKGRVVVSGEAAMYSAQTMGTAKAGMNAPEGAQNYLLLLSLAQWLDTLPPGIR